MFHRCPVFIIHGTSDKIVPFWHAPKLLSYVNPAYRVEPYYAEGLGHNNIESKDKDEYIRRINLFLQQHFPSAGAIEQNKSDKLRNKKKNPFDKEGFDNTKASENQNFQSWFEKVWVNNWRCLWFINDSEEDNNYKNDCPVDKFVESQQAQKIYNCTTKEINEDCGNFNVEITQSMLNISHRSTPSSVDPVRASKNRRVQEYYVRETNEEIEILPEKFKKDESGTKLCQKKSNNEIKSVELAINTIDDRSDYYECKRYESKEVRA